MKFLADMNMSMSTVQYLRSNGYDAIHLREQGLERASDTNVIQKAKEEGRIILTFDLDFGDLMARSREELPSVVIFRLHDETPPAVLPRLKDILLNCSEDLQKGALILAGNSRNRIRRLPLLEHNDES
jgi:predicted nuclease of predicted toxin-antitoxin system